MTVEVLHQNLFYVGIPETHKLKIFAKKTALQEMELKINGRHNRSA